VKLLANENIPLASVTALRNGGHDVLSLSLSKRGLMQPDTHGNFWKLIFAKPITSPLALGFVCHYGLGMFKPGEGRG